MTRSVSQVPPNPALAGVQQALRRKPLNASRSFEVNRSVFGLKDGAPIIQDQAALLPRTGIATIDNANERATSIRKYGQGAITSTIMATIKGSFCGAICGLIVAALSQRNALLKLFQKQLPAPLFIAAAILAPVGAGIGGFFGFTGAVRKNITDGRTLLQEQLSGQRKHKPDKEPKPEATAAR